MNRSVPEALIAELEAALDWWREAGVDCAFVDDPRPWLAEETQGEKSGASIAVNGATAPDAIPASRIPNAKTIGGDRAVWPTELADFASWWLIEPTLDAGQLRGRVPPRGTFAAPLMVLVPEPEAGDSDFLLAGQQGKLLTAMVAAMGLTPAEVYVASALPRHTPMADWGAIASQGMGAVLMHHVALARPQRVIAFGRHVATLLGEPSPRQSWLRLPLPAHDPTQKPDVLPSINQEEASVSLLVARDLGSLLERPIAKGNFWQHWLEWSGG